MKIYILDDDKTVIKQLSQIIEQENLGNVVTTSQNPLKSIEEYDFFDLDLIVIDLLMEGLDGIAMVREIKAKEAQIEILMISQVSNKEMIAKAYEAGVRYFITKPINRIEVAAIIRTMGEFIELKNKFKVLSEVFQGVAGDHPTSHLSFEERAVRVLKDLGIWGEKGAQEILVLAGFLKNHPMSVHEHSLRELMEAVSNDPVNFEQRIRRAITRGFSNLVAIGLEDNLNTTFLEYANSFFDFESIQKEMQSKRGGSSRGGKINIKKFIENLIIV
ncbi:MAG: hypothetical protein AVO33_02390 [delta proteobacterium ML8_F1]|nr:MAG: hypothetical protein AVO33_02390 [delta proteobacterium ML8_F1]